MEPSNEVIRALALKHGCKIWVCQDGSLVPVNLTTDRHIAAAWRVAIKNLAEVDRIVSEEARGILTALSYFSPDSAAAAYIDRWDDDILGFGDVQPTEAKKKQYRITSALSTLKAEAERRGKPHLTPEE